MKWNLNYSFAGFVYGFVIFMTIELCTRYLFNKSSSKSSTTNNTDNIGFNEVEGEVTFIKGSGNTITDGGAIAGAFDTVNSLINATTTQSQQNQQILSSAIAANSETTQEAMQGDSKVMADVVKVGLAVFAVIAVAKAWKK